MSYNETHHSRRSRKRWTGWASALAIACCLSWAFVWSAAAQNRCYRLIDLGPLLYLPLGANELFGINNNGQGVFTAEVNQKKHAMLYLPTAAFNLAAGCHDLHELAGLDGDESSVAHDINESGIVAGYRTVNGERHAFIWRLDLPQHEFIDLGTFFDGDSSEAFAVNDDPNPWIVGTGEYSSDCDCEGSGFAMGLAFATTLDVAPLGLDFAAKLFDDPNFGCHAQTQAWDINTAQVLTVAGNFGFGGGCPNGSSRATVWTNPILGANNDGTALAQLPPGFGSNAWGVSNLGPIVGVSQAEQSQQHAVFWPDPGVMDPLDLATLPGIPGGSQPKAYRINNLTDIDVVGRSSGVLGVALLWECSTGCDNLTNWSVVDLNDQLTSGCQSTVNWTLRRADDVNDNGMIISVTATTGALMRSSSSRRIRAARRIWTGTAPLAQAICCSFWRLGVRARIAPSAWRTWTVTTRLAPATCSFFWPPGGRAGFPSPPGRPRTSRTA